MWMLLCLTICECMYIYIYTHTLVHFTLKPPFLPKIIDLLELMWMWKQTLYCLYCIVNPLKYDQICSGVFHSENGKGRGWVTHIISLIDDITYRSYFSLTTCPWIGAVKLWPLTFLLCFPAAGRDGPVLPGSKCSWVPSHLDCGK